MTVPFDRPAPLSPAVRQEIADRVIAMGDRIAREEKARALQILQDLAKAYPDDRAADVIRKFQFIWGDH